MGRSGHAMQWTCAGGDSACLIAAMTAANTAPGSYADHVIVLGAGLFTFVAPDPSAPTGDTALPLVTGGMTILGAGSEQTEILRAPGASGHLRFFEVAAGGTLVLADVAVEGGWVPMGAAALKNSGTLALYRTIVRWNTGTAIWSEGVFGMVGGNVYGNGGILTEAAGLVVAGGSASVVDSFVWWNSAGPNSDGGGILVKQGTLTVRGSTLSHNVTGGPGGGLANGGLDSLGGEVLVSESFIGHNASDHGSGIFNRGVMEIVNSTIHDNVWAAVLQGDQIADVQTGTLLITQSTIVHLPVATHNLEGLTVSGVVLLHNSILWGGPATPDPHTKANDCLGPVISLGNNIIGDPTGCDITLQPGDRTGDPGLDTFVDLGIPGHSYFPLLPTSQARGAANPAVCPQFDQIGTPREVVCDIGAIERFEGTGGVAQR
jgi:hypothetical protein